MADPVWANFGAPDENTAPAPAASKPWDDFGSPQEAVAPAAQGQLTDPSKPANFDLASAWAENTKDVGFSPEFKHALGMDGMNDSVAAKLFGKINQVLTAPLLGAQYGLAGLQTAADTADAGLSDIGYRTGLNKLIGTDRINPFNTALEAVNAVGPETQLLNGGGALPVVSDAAVSDKIMDIVHDGVAAGEDPAVIKATVGKYVQSYGGDPAKVGNLDQAISDVKSGKQIGVAVEGDTPAPTLTPQDQQIAQANDAYEAAKAKGNPDEIDAAYDNLVKAHGGQAPDRSIPQVDDTQNPNAIVNGGTGEGSSPRDLQSLAENRLNPMTSPPIETTIPENPLAKDLGVDLPNTRQPSFEGLDEPTPQPTPEPTGDISPSEPTNPSAGTELPPQDQSQGLPLNEQGEVVAPKEDVVAQTPHTPEEIDDATDRVTQQLEAASKARQDAEGLLAENRKAQASRLQKAIEDAGENGSESERLIKMKEALKGKVDRPNLPSIREQLDPEDLNRLSSRIMANPQLRAFEKFRSANAFSRLIDGEHLQPNELLLLQKTFPSKTLKAFIKNADDLKANGLTGQGELFKQGEVLSSGPIHGLKPEEKPVDPEKYIFNKNQGDLFPDSRETKVFPNDKAKPTAKTPEPYKTHWFVEAANSLKSLKATLDLSAPGRQGLPLVMTKEYWKGIPKMIRQFGSEATFDALQNQIKTSPNFERMQTAGLELPGAGKALMDREEQFISHLPEKIPVFGHLHRASERAYTGFLNQLRADTFDRIMTQSKAAGMDIDDPAFLKSIGGVINNLTGRGDLGKFNQAATQLNTVFFSPRFLTSRVQMLNPQYYAKLSPVARKEALKGLVALGAVNLSFLGLAKLAGAHVTADPRSSDFGKAVFDNPGGAKGAAMSLPGLIGAGVNTYNGQTRIDFAAGEAPIMRTLSILASGSKINSKGEVVKLNDKFGGPTYSDIVTSFVRSKLSPAAGLAVDLKTGKDFVGQPVTLKNELLNAVEPLSINDAYDGYYPNQNSKPTTGARSWDNFK